MQRGKYAWSQHAHLQCIRYSCLPPISVLYHHMLRSSHACNMQALQSSASAGGGHSNNTICGVESSRFQEVQKNGGLEDNWFSYCLDNGWNGTDLTNFFSIHDAD